MDDFQLFCSLVASQVTKGNGHRPLSPQALSLLDADRLTSIYPIAKRQDLAHLVCAAIEDAHLLPPTHPTLAHYKKQLHLAVLRCHRIEYELEQLKQTLNAAGIIHIPLKGAVLRPLYPTPWMRTSCDIDLLVPPDEIDRASAAICATGYTERSRNYHDYSLQSPSGVHLELHFRINENSPRHDPLLEQVWDYAHPVSPDSKTLELDRAYFYFYILAHAAHHCAAGGGCGLRPVIDLWLMHRHMPCDAEKLDALLEPCGLEPFYRAMSELGQTLFSDAPSSPLTDLLLSYLLRAGIYGLMEHQVALREDRLATTSRYLRARLFLSREALQYRYPVLQRHPALLPLCNLSRWIELLFNGRLHLSVKEWRLMRRQRKRNENPEAALIAALGLSDERA